MSTAVPQALAFVGLGSMGAPMAARLVAAGHRVTVWNRSAGRTAPLVEAGASAAATPAAAVAAAQIVFTMLADDAALDAVASGPDGLVAGMSPGALHVSMSTIAPATAERLAATHAAAGQAYVAAPVFGRPPAAAAGALFILASGADADIARAAPLLAALGQRLFPVGSAPRQANVVKLAGNFMIMAATEAMGEAMAVAGQAGIAPATLLEVFTGTLFDSPITRNYGAMLVEERFHPAGFSAALGRKDMRLFAEVAAAAQVPAPFLTTIEAQLAALVARHGPDIDWAAIGALPAEAARAAHHPENDA